MTKQKDNRSHGDEDVALGKGEDPVMDLGEWLQAEWGRGAMLERTRLSGSSNREYLATEAKTGRVGYTFGKLHYI